MIHCLIMSKNANAMEVLKEKADYITKSNDEDGPAIVLKKILKK